MIKPTIGRVVWFYPPVAGVPDFNIIHSNPPQPCEARIAYVWSDSMINICATDHHGFQRAFTSVRLIQPEEPKPEEGFFCGWMPYQTSVAAGVTAPNLHKVPT